VTLYGLRQRLTTLGRNKFSHTIALLGGVVDQTRQAAVFGQVALEPLADPLGFHPWAGWPSPPGYAIDFTFNRVGVGVASMHQIGGNYPDNDEGQGLGGQGRLSIGQSCLYIFTISEMGIGRAVRQLIKSGGLRISNRPFWILFRVIRVNSLLGT
jgi:hypothetical protein